MWWESNSRMQWRPIYFCRCCRNMLLHMKPSRGILWKAVLCLLLIVSYSFLPLFRSNKLPAKGLTSQRILPNRCGIDGYRSFFEDYRNCLRQDINWINFLWSNMPKIVSNCLPLKVLTEIFQVTAMVNWDEQKLVVPQKRTWSRRPCAVVSLGIGGEISAERQLRFFQPSCKFYGADPVRGAGTPYLQIGKYYHQAIRAVARKGAGEALS